MIKMPQIIKETFFGKNRYFFIKMIFEKRSIKSIEKAMGKICSESGFLSSNEAFPFFYIITDKIEEDDTTLMAIVLKMNKIQYELDITFNPDGTFGEFGWS